MSENLDSELDADVSDDLDIDSSADAAFENALERVESEVQGDDPVVDPVETDLDEEQEITEEANELEDTQTPEDYLEELKQSGDEKKAKQFGSLVESNRELKQFKDDAEPRLQQFDGLMSQITEDAGLSPESFADFIDVFAAVKNGAPTPDVQQIADNFTLRMAQNGFIDLSRLNVYSGHPDIAQGVQSMDMAPEVAQELIKSREFQKQQQNYQQAAQQRQQEVNQFEQDKSTAMQNVDQVAQQLSSQNADHNQIEDLIKEDYWQWAQSSHPRTWAGEYQRLYNIAATSMRSGSSRAKQSSNHEVLSPNGKRPTNEMPTWSEDSMIDHAFARMEQEG